MTKDNYELLSIALSYPQAELLKLIRDGVFDETFGKKAPVPADLEELEVEYCRLFVGPGHVDVPPYESVYNDDNDSTMQKGLVMGQATEEVVRLYERAGLKIKDEFNDMPDHIAVEMLFVAYLEVMSQKDPEGGFEEQKREFINDHLGKWALVFAEEVKKKSHHPWYLYVAELLTDTISKELS